MRPGRSEDTGTPDRIRHALVEVADEFPALAAVYLYGSAATGDAHPGSDVDLALVLEPGSEPGPLFAESVSVRVGERLGFRVEVDAHLATRLPLPVLGRVITEGFLVFERDPRTRVEFETATRRLYFDFLPLLERDVREALRRG